MRTIHIESHLSAAEVERIILSRDYVTKSESLIDQFLFVRSRRKICFINHGDEIVFAYRGGWSGGMYPVSSMSDIKHNGKNYLRLRFKLNNYGKLITWLVFLFALSGPLSQIGTQLLHSRSPLLFILFDLVFTLVFTGPFLLIARQARKETVYFIQDILSDNPVIR